MEDPTRLEGKLVLVTGAGTGIGQGVALELARRGADVALHYASSAAGALVAVEQICAMGRRAVAVQGDLGKVEECRQVVDQAAEFLGGLDGLVSNAGITATYDFLDATPEQFDRLYHVNIRSQFFCAQRAVPYMLERGRSYSQRHPEQAWAGGSIVNISSVHAIVGLPGHSIYAGTKGAINSFSRELAIELTRMHIRVNVLAPGSIEVPSYFSGGSGYTRELGDSLVPWGRVGLPADVGYASAYMLSDAAEFLTGQVIFLDGGLTAQMALPYQPASGERKTNDTAGA
jgi:NAD(P)-dependent dehydrogenase (short-subunit alcohol dehydrogenase family)